MPSKQRCISLDLYRILCMFLITTVHITNYSRIIDDISSNHFNFYILNLLSMVQRFSITGFVLISAYFLTSTTDTVRKIIAFWLQLLFLSIAIFLFACLLEPSLFSFKYLIKSVFPVFSYHYWYPVSYIILLLFVPILNKISKSLPQKDLLRTLVLLGFFLSCFFHLNPLIDETVFIGHPSHSLLLFLFLYLIAAYIRLYGVSRPIFLGPVTFGISGSLLFLLFFVKQYARKAGAAYLPILYFFDQVNLLSYNSVLSILLSVSSFIMFLNLKISPPKWLTAALRFLVPSIFCIYLIQEHNALRSPFWRFVNINRFAQSPWLLLIMVLVFLALWAAAVGLHLLYRLAHKLFLRKLEDALFGLSVKIKNRLH